MKNQPQTITVGVDRRVFLQKSVAAAGALALPGLLASPAAAKVRKVNARGVADLTTNIGSSGYLLQFKKYIEKSSNGEVQVQYLSYEELDATWDTVVSQTISGQIQMSLPLISYLYNYFPDLQVANLPFLFKSNAQAARVLSGPIGTEIRAATLKKTGLRLAPFSPNGFLGLPNSVHPIHSPEDVKGLKVRVQSAGVLADSIDALGADPSVISITELYTSLQTGAVNAAAINANTVESYQLAPVLPYFPAVNMTPNIKALMFNNRWYMSLGADTRKLIDAAGVKAAKWDIASENQIGNSLNGQLRGAGVKINNVSPQQIGQFRDAVQPVWHSAKSYGPYSARWLKELSNAV